MRWILIYSCIVLTGCLNSNPEYKTVNEQIEFKLHQFDDGKPISEFPIISVALTVTDTSYDTLHYVPNYQYFIKLKERPLDSIWQKFHVNDSVTLKLSRKMINRYFKFYQLLQSDEGRVLMHARIKKAYNSEEDAENAKKEILSRRELLEQAELKRYMKRFTNSFDTIDGVYRIIKKREANKKSKIRFGSEVSLHYTGRFLDGYIFDNTYEKGISPTFIYGQDYQLIEGMHSGLKGCKEGDSVKIIVPSRQGFGEEGSLAGIVPPYTAVIFDINIVKVIN